MRIDLAGFAREDAIGDHQALMRLVERADAYGYGGIWFNEFHFRRDTNAYPSTLLLGAEILARTERLRFGTSVLVLPLHHPLLLAEQVAQLDFQSQGRVDVGVGRGTDPASFRALGLGEAVMKQRFEEALGIMLMAWQQPSVSSDGPGWHFSDVAVGPPVVQRPHPPIYIAGVSDQTIDLAARKGFPLLLSLEPNEERQLPRFRQALARHGGAPDALMASSLSRYIIIAETKKAASAQIERFMERINARRNALARMRGEEPPARRGLQELVDGYTIFGTPDMCLTQLQALSAQSGARSIRLMFSGNGLLPLDEAETAMSLFARTILAELTTSHDAGAELSECLRA
ncbi:LLM class flavin-dependent oxidoreductase [Martelella alba]|uniref:LLM class flavin-dependent oxidoreductase n=1 Tax=Martelella alba TaxID=2590451 RepID=A0A506TWH7_9HYPH|nr:LLM class flavin-dependent oxidoreductase [Martelella alba]TPW26432.1 LLM class flavin-dependent oxidoreductase [Martelella alba]